MGFLRLYLAVCVLFVHSKSSFIPWDIHDGYEAVQIFFMISGFYMSLIASKYLSAKQFYTSRFLRIFVPYWFMLLIVIAISLGSGIIFGNWLELNPYLEQPLAKNGFVGIAFTTLTNLTIFFQDWVMFLKHDLGGQLTLTNNFRESATPLFPYLLIPQAWSVGLELMFYVLFPFLNRLRNRHLISIIVISVFARFFAYTVLKLDTDPWNYRFFPFEIALFVAGMLVFRVYSSLSWKDNPYPIKNPIIYFMTCIVLFSLFIGAKFLFTVSSRYIDANYARFGLYLLWLSVIPVLFHFFKSSDIDRFVGELSYPVYLSHLIMIAFIRMMLGVTGLSDDSLGILSLVATVLWSIVFYVLLVKRLDEFRYKIIFKQA